MGSCCMGHLSTHGAPCMRPSVPQAFLPFLAQDLKHYTATLSYSLISLLLLDQAEQVHPEREKLFAQCAREGRGG